MGHDTQKQELDRPIILLNKKEGIGTGAVL